READVAREYLKSRGVTSEWAKTFKLGYHPGGRDWLARRTAARGTFRPEDLYAAGIAKEFSGRPSDELLFQGRLVFPIRDERGRAVAFGGRVIPGVEYPTWGDRKYVNSGDNPLFPKSRTLYGLDLAKAAIRRPDPHRIAVVMEGFTDVIAAHQAGVTNAVAPLGTAMTDEHVTLLKRFAERIVLVFDGDQAGRAAAGRAVEKVLAADVDVRVLTLPDGADPADFLGTRGGDEFRRLIEAAPDAVAFQVDDSLGRHDATTPTGRQNTADEVLTTLAASRPDRRRVDAVLATLADRLLMNEAALRERLSELRSRSGGLNRGVVSHNTAEPTHDTDALPVGRDDDPLEREVLASAMHFPALFDRLRGEVGPDDFRPGPLRGLFEQMIDVAEIEGPPAYELLISQLDSRWSNLLVSIDVEAREKRLSVHTTTTDTGGEDAPAADDRDRTETAGELPSDLGRAVAALRRRRQRDLFERSKGQIAEKRVADGDVLDERMKDLLRRADSIRRDRDDAAVNA
ncbi:MAG: toprim domain-containing protein, partial [Planctomycetota bacterium]